MDGTGDVPRLPDGTPIEEEELSQHLQKPEHKPSHADIHYEDASTKGERKLTAEELERFLPPGDGGVVIQAKLVLDNGEEIAARRPQPLPVKASELFAALVAFGGEGRYAYSGAGLNGWAALTCMELRSITAQSTSRRIVGSHPVIKVWEAPDLRESRGNSYPSPQEAVEQHRLGASKGNAAVTPRKSSGGVVADSSEGGDIASDMDALAFGDDFMKPSKAQSNKKVSAPTISSAGDGDQFTYLVTLRCAPWTLTGWSKDSPGCVWWYEKYSRPVALVGPHDAPGRVLCGSGMIDFVLKDGSDADPECGKKSSCAILFCYFFIEHSHKNTFIFSIIAMHFQGVVLKHSKTSSLTTVLSWSSGDTKAIADPFLSLNLPLSMDALDAAGRPIGTKTNLSQ